MKHSFFKPLIDDSKFIAVMTKFVFSMAIAEIESTIFVDYSEQEQEQIQELVNILSKDDATSHLDLLKSHVAMTDAYRSCDTWKIVGWNIDEL